MQSAGRSFPPVMFVTQLRSQFPQFAQTSAQSGGYMQQDAEEFYNVLAMSISSALEASGADGVRARDSLLNMQADETISCTECPEEPATTRRVNINRLVCNIQGGHGSTTVINHLHEGLRLGLNSSVEKLSPILGRNAEWAIRQQLAKLPRFLCVQFMRFFWKPTPESRDHTGVKCKILRPVTFQEVSAVRFQSVCLRIKQIKFNVFMLCTRPLMCSNSATTA
jgi:ubiquitin carboxyl-terminal hydrolase 14